jgi:hypothetical protein
LSWKNDAFARMVHEIYEVLLRTHQTPEQTPSQSAFSAFLRCPHNCIFEDSAEHNGPARARNTNLSGLASETMWSQPILIELLAVLLLLQNCERQRGKVGGQVPYLFSVYLVKKGQFYNTRSGEFCSLCNKIKKNMRWVRATRFK